MAGFAALHPPYDTLHNPASRLSPGTRFRIENGPGQEAVGDPAPSGGYRRGGLIKIVGTQGGGQPSIPDRSDDHSTRVKCGAVRSCAPPFELAPRALSVDDLMTLRSILDVQISPDGQRVAYVVSTPNLATNEHDGALFVVAAAGGPPTRLAGTIKIFNRPTPRPQLRGADR